VCSPAKANAIRSIHLDVAAQRLQDVGRQSVVGDPLFQLLKLVERDDQALLV
jgi:hypothetical protein